ncbi:MAG TPA: glycosyltransferase family 9 protein [Azospirillum sp.]|nr:glycosyltransferase family 9 protein [Azospirillum sp.]
MEVLDAAVNHHVAGRLNEAERLYRLVLAVEPAAGQALHLLGVLEGQRGGAARAALLLGRAVHLDPDAAGPRAQRSGALRALALHDAAAVEARRALLTDPGLADAAANLGAAQVALGDCATAAVWLWRAHRLRPEQTETLLNLGMALRDLRRFGDAETCLRAALARRPNDADTHLALAVSRLVQGDLAGGWAEFEWRWQRLPGPVWAGEPLEGASILLHAEQGFGDTIQFARYAPLVAARGGRVILEVHPLLVRLLATLAPDVRVIARADTPPRTDHHCPLMSLPRAFGTTLTTIPANVPYLRPSEEDAGRWRRRLDGAPGLRVGLVWAGNPRHRNDRNRSLPVRHLAPLLGVPGVRFFSLQTGDARAALSALPGGAAVEDAMADVRDFAETAALLVNLDLVIAVDTAIVHLAGALGVPCWALLAHAPDWRWLLDRPDSPWYPSLRLFRQPRPGDWGTVTATAAAVLRAVTARQERAARREPSCESH